MQTTVCSVTFVATSASVARPKSFGLSASILFALMMLCLLPGCVGGRAFGWRHSGDTLAGAPKPRWADDPQVEEVVDHLNRNVEKLQAWRANSVKIRANNMPLSGTLAVERGRRLRLVVNSIAGNEVDMGSNDELFWIWAKRMPPPEYVYCRHEQTETVRQAMGIPFEPEWLMQALGVSPLSAEGTSLEIEPTAHQARLVQQVTSAHGRPLRKVIVVDLPRGVILEHCVYDYNGQKIAQARLEDHHLEKVSGVVLPHRVRLDWPQNAMSLVMHLGHVEVNPQGIPPQIWEMPKMPGYELVDLGAMVRPGVRMADNQPSVRASGGPVEFLPPEFDKDDNAGRARLTDEGLTESNPQREFGTPVDFMESSETEGPVHQMSAPSKKPIPKDWWDE